MITEVTINLEHQEPCDGIQERVDIDSVTFFDKLDLELTEESRLKLEQYLLDNRATLNGEY